MRSVLVTGGNGFIGRYVVERLLRESYQPVVLDTRLRPVPDGASLVLGDIRDATAVTEAVAHVEGAIHLAGVLGTQETITNPRPAVEVNVLGGLNVFEACLQYDVPLVNIAVGNWWMNNTYSITKSTMERFADMARRFRGGRISVVRALNAYGPRQSVSAPYGDSKVRKVMPSFICRALSGEALEVYGEGDQIMDMIYVEDVADILVRTLEHTVAAEAIVVEAGTGIRTTINQIAETVIDAVGSGAVRHLPMRPGEDNHSVVLGNPETLDVLGLGPEDLKPLPEGVAAAVDYYRWYLKGQA